MSVRAAILAAARARYHEATALLPDQIRDSLKERHTAEDRLAGHLLMNLSERESTEIKRAMREMRVHVMTLPAIREKHRRSMIQFRKEIDEWWQEKENELTVADMK
uniref:Uncharacterized protein n=1 Tax=viral metagenome TaxID=1070528 RepID=A0A6C0CHF2_9ZZZZ